MNADEQHPPSLTGTSTGDCAVCGQSGAPVVGRSTESPGMLVAMLEVLGVSPMESRTRFHDHQRANGWDAPGSARGLRVCDDCTSRYEQDFLSRQQS